MYYLEKNVQGLHIQVHQPFAMEEDQRRRHIHRNLPSPAAAQLVSQ